MAFDEFKHTTAAEMEEFLGRSPSEQSLRIWLNARETNGVVADITKELSNQGLEIQKARMDLSDHVNHNHLDGHEMDELRKKGGIGQINHARMEMWERVNTMWSTYDFARRLIRVIGVVWVTEQMVIIAAIGWWLKMHS